MNKRYVASFLFLCFVVFNVQAMDRAMIPAADGEDHFSTLPNDLMPQIIIPYGEKNETIHGLPAAVAERYKDIALVNKRLKGVVNSIPFTRSLNRSGLFFGKGDFYFNLTPIAKKYHSINEAIILDLATIVHYQQELNKSKGTGSALSKDLRVREIEQKIDFFNNKVYSLATSEAHEFFDAGYIDYKYYGGKENMLTQAVRTNNSQLVGSLLTNRANPNAPLRGINPVIDHFPLFIACREQFPQASNTSEALAVCHVLLDAKANVNIDDCVSNALHHLIWGITNSEHHNAQLDESAAQLVIRLINANADVNVMNENGMTISKRLCNSAYDVRQARGNHTPYLKVAMALVEGGLDMQRVMRPIMFPGETNAECVRNYVALCPDSLEKIELLKKLQ